MISLARYAAGLVSGFLVVVAVWCGLFFASFGLFDAFGDRNVFAWYQIKRGAIAARSGSPKIILAGGSNVLYGMRAEDIERELHVPSVNYGTHAALPLDYLIDRWKSALDPGDLLVLSLEWSFLDHDTDEVNAVFAGYMLGGDPGYFFEMGWRTQAQIILTTPPGRLLLPLYLSRKENQQMQAVYREWILAYYVNKFGDYFWNDASRSDRAHLEELQAAAVRKGHSLDKATADTPFWRTLANFAAWAKKRDITVVFAAPSVLENSEMDGPKSRKFFEAAEAHYRAIGIPVISPQSGNFYPLELMFDSIYHPNADGSRERTKRLILALAPIVAGRIRHTP